MVLFRSCSRGRALLVAVLFAGCASSSPASAPDQGPAPDRGGGVDARDSRVSVDASVTPGDPGRLLLRGTVVTPDEVIEPGEVLTDGDRLVCVASSCAQQPGADGATIIDTGGIIFPGLVDAHNHTDFDYQPVWHNAKTYGNHRQWQGDSAYEQAVAGAHRGLKTPDGTDGKGACAKPEDCETRLCGADGKCEGHRHREVDSLHLCASPVAAEAPPGASDTGYG